MPKPDQARVRLLVQDQKRLEARRRRLEKRRENIEAEMERLETTIHGLGETISWLSDKLKYCACDCQKCCDSEALGGCCAACHKRYLDSLIREARAKRHPDDCDCTECDGSYAHY